MIDKELSSFILLAKENRLLQSLSVDDLKELSTHFTARFFSKGTVIVREHAYKESGFYIIASGWVKVVSFGKEGAEQIYSVLTRHDFFGEMSLLEDKPTSAAVVAKNDCVIYSLERQYFFKILEQYPKFTIELLKLLSARIRSANRLVTSFAFMSASKKLKLYILDLSHRRGTSISDGKIEIENVPTQREIGSAIGHRRETVARELKKLTDQKIISYTRNRVVVYDENSLQD